MYFGGRDRFGSGGKIEDEVPPPYIGRCGFIAEKFMDIVPPGDVPLLPPNFFELLPKTVEELRETAGPTPSPSWGPNKPPERPASPPGK